MKQNNIDDLKSQLDQIQAALSALGAGNETPADEPDGPAVDETDEATVVDEKAETDVVDDQVVDAEADDSDTDVIDDESDDADEAGEPRPVAGVRRLVPRTRLARSLVAAIIVLALAGAGAAYFLTRNDKLPGNVAFRVYGHNVSVDELNSEVETLSALYGIQAPTDPKKLETFRRDVAKATAVSRILDRAASSRDIVIADKAARDVLTRYISQQFGSGADAYDTFVKALGGVGTSEAAVLTEIKRQLALNQLYNKVTAGITVSDAEVRAAFTKDHRTLDTPELRQIRNIVVATKEQATQLRAKLAAGGSFAALAKTYSLDASTSAKGGDLGKVAAADLETDYAKAAFAATAGSVFGPVKTQYGWNVGQVASIAAPTPAVYASVKATLKDQLLLKRQLEAWREWLAKQIRGAHVRYASAYRPADPNAAPSTSPGQLDIPSGAATGASSAPPK